MIRQNMNIRSGVFIGLKAAGDDVTTGAQRSIRLLDAIDETIGALCYEQKMLGSAADFIKSIVDELRAAPPDVPLDVGGDVDQTLLKAQETVERLYDRLVEQRQAARRDLRLRDDDGVVDEFTRAIEVVADLHNTLNEVRWIIMEHNADLDSPTTTPMTTAAEVKAYLESL